MWSNLITAGLGQRQHKGWPTASFSMRPCRWFGRASVQRSEAFCCRKVHEDAELLWGLAEGPEAFRDESLSTNFSVKKIETLATMDSQLKYITYSKSKWTKNTKGFFLSDTFTFLDLNFNSSVGFTKCLLRIQLRWRYSKRNVLMGWRGALSWGERGCKRVH